MLASLAAASGLVRSRTSPGVSCTPPPCGPSPPGPSLFPGAAAAIPAAVPGPPPVALEALLHRPTGDWGWTGEGRRIKTPPSPPQGPSPGYQHGNKHAEALGPERIVGEAAARPEGTGRQSEDPDRLRISGHQATLGPPPMHHQVVHGGAICGITKHRQRDRGAYSKYIGTHTWIQGCERLGSQIALEVTSYANKKVRMLGRYA
jgi:hypothetical protein